MQTLTVGIRNARSVMGAGEAENCLVMAAGGTENLEVMAASEIENREASASRSQKVPRAEANQLLHGATADAAFGRPDPESLRYRDPESATRSLLIAATSNRRANPSGSTT